MNTALSAPQMHHFLNRWKSWYMRTNSYLYFVYYTLFQYDHATLSWILITLQLRHNEHDGVSNHEPHDCLQNHLFRRRSKKTSKLRVTGLCEGNSPVTGEFPAQRASKAQNVSIWWRHHIKVDCMLPRGMTIFKINKQSAVILFYSKKRTQ